MKAWLYERFGGPEVLELREIEKPAPGPGQVLIANRATTVTAADWRVRSLEVPAGFGLLARPMFGFTRPRQPILGTELAGVIEAVGEGVRRFAVGDEVFAFPGGKTGAHAEYVVMAEDAPIAAKPDNLDFGEAAALSFGGTTALYFLDKADVGPGVSVMVVGASGGVGTATVQLASHLGAAVTGVTSTPNLALVRQLGAREVIDYTGVDYLKSDTRWDVVIDTVGAVPVASGLQLLNDGGRLALVAAGLPDMLGAVLGRKTGGRKVIVGTPPERADDLIRLADLARLGVFTPHIDRTFGFAQMREAHAYVDTRRKRGNVVVSVP